VIVIIDTGVANLSSVHNAIERLGRTAERSCDPARIRAATHVILPGVGAAADAMAHLSAAGLVPIIRGLTQPVLGICLGMQLYFERSTEGDAECLGLLPGIVSAIVPDPEHGITVPHMGWNCIERQGGASILLEGIDRGAYFYFVHSFKAPDGPFVRATTDHGGRMPAVVEHRNFFGTQFHPERSGAAGAKLLEGFLSL
jgi:imidazole glycerol-phosphate synthase subunit HisH